MSLCEREKIVGTKKRDKFSWFNDDTFQQIIDEDKEKRYRDSFYIL